MDKLQVLETVLSCENCGLHKIGRGPVPFTIPANPNGITILGEAPGRQEDAAGKPFVGPAGKLLREALEKAGIDSERCFITNTVSCWPDRTPNQDEIDACGAVRRIQVDYAKSPWVLVLGSIALGATRRGLRISIARGKPFGSSCTYFPTWHPAAALRKERYKNEMFEDIQAFAGIVSKGSWEAANVCWECNQEEPVWIENDGIGWCERHATHEFKRRKEELRADYERAKVGS